MSKEHVQKTWGIPVGAPELSAHPKNNQEKRPRQKRKDREAGKRWEERMKQEIEGEGLMAK